MAKILLAEDDANLREIFEMRLKAEGFEVLTAGDGEEALVVATKEMPDLIVVDIMMPKISGFEMLETLRTNPATAKIKAIMMTALGQAEDRERGTSLGVLKYLVKSQVTLEDFVRTVKDALGISQPNNQTRSNMDQNQSNNAPTDPGMPADTGSTPAPSEPAAAPDAAQPAASSSLPSDEQTTAQESAEVQSQEDSYSATPPAPAEPSEPAAAPASEPSEPADTGSTPAPSEPAAAPDAAESTDESATPGQTISPDQPSQT